MYTGKKIFEFGTCEQATAFGEAVNVFGKVNFFGRRVIFLASLDFSVWRKINTLAILVCKKFSGADGVRELAEEAGLLKTEDAEGKNTEYGVRL